MLIVSVSAVDTQFPAPGHPLLQQYVKGPVPVTVAVNVAVPPTQIVCGVGAIEQVGRAAMVTLCCGETLTLRLQAPCAFGNDVTPLVNSNVKMALPAAMSAAVNV